MCTRTLKRRCHKANYQYTVVGFFIAVLSGILMSVQGIFNTQVTKQSSLWTTSAFVQLTALLVCVLAWLFTDRSNPLKVLAAKPSYLLLGGVIGAFITYTVVVSMGKLGPAKAVMFIVIAQLISAYLIELLGMFGVEKEPFSVRKLGGMAVAVIGVIVFKM